MKVTYRKIARILVRALPLDDEELPQAIEQYTKAIEAMPEKARFALQSAYIFSSKVPPKERGDMFQDIVYAVLRKSKDGEAIAYMTGRGKWLDTLPPSPKGQCHKKKHLPTRSLNEVIATDKYGHQVELGDTIVGMDDLEDKVIERVEAQRLYRELPRHIKLLVKRMFRGEALLPRERFILSKFRKELRSSNPDYKYPLLYGKK